MSNILWCCSRLPRNLVVGIALGVFVWFGSALSTASAQDFPGLTNPYSPIVSLSRFHAEAKVRPFFGTISSGRVTSTTGQGQWGLKESFHMDSNELFLDAMVRMQAGRLSIRGHYEPREFSGSGFVGQNPAAPQADARLDYSGVRVGADVDIVQWNMSRVGLNIDYDTYPLVFTEAIETPGGVKMKGKEVVTLGLHAVYSPPGTFYGMSGIFEFRARWPVSRTEVTDVDFSVGAKAPETVLGSMSVRTGYRVTTLELSDSHRTLDAVVSGWFSELAYHY